MSVPLLGVLPVFSQPVLLASIASPDPTLPALEDILWKIVITLFALVGSINPTPALMCAVVAVSEVLNRLLHLYQLFRDRRRISRPLTRHDLLRSSQKTIFIPLVAGTGLPALSADVAELRATRTAGTRVSLLSVQKRYAESVRHVVTAHI